MQIHVLEYLERSSALYPDKVVYQDEQTALTFSQVKQRAKQIGSFLCSRTEKNQPIVIFSEKSVETPLLYLGALYSGCFYVPIGTDLPRFRINLILETVQAGIILTDSKNVKLAQSLDFQGQIYSLEECESEPVREDLLQKRMDQALDTDPMYVIFTSGSTGKPKGVIESHRAVIDYIDAFAQTFHLTQDDRFGNQAPLDYIAAIRDIYLPLKTGASTVFIPKKMFSFPVKLFEYLNENKVTTICWVASALCLCVELHAFSGVALETVNKVFFTGSVMPCKYLREWQEALPHALYVNHYGPTEITASCTYYVVDHPVEPEEVLPIGTPFRNTGILLLKEDGTEAKDGEYGEICVKGTCLALGYYHNPEKTKESFVNNPLNTIYAEPIYKTGDLGSMNADGLLEFHGRKDFQIKHMGHRIELGEIEGVVRAMPEIRDCCCLYYQEKEQLWLFYVGENADNRSVTVYMRERLPGFMIPRNLAMLDAMPVNFNGKLDLEALRARMRQG